MKKIIYTFFIAASIIVLAGCLKSGNAPAGPTGASGATGPAGGSLPIIPIQGQLYSSSFNPSGAPGYWFYGHPFPGYDSAYSYDVELFINRQSTPTAKEWYKCPLFNLYTSPGSLASADEVFSSIGHDTVYIWYYNPGATPWPDTSVVNYNLYVLPILKKI